MLLLVQNILFSRLLSINAKIKIKKTRILPVIWYGCVAWSFTLSQEHKLGVFESRALRKVFGHTGRR